MKQRDLTQGSLTKAMVSFSLPYLLSCFMQMLYNVADLMIVGHYCDVPNITAVSIGGQVMHFLTVMIVGLAMGPTVMLARAVGAKNDRQVAKIAGNTISLFAIAGVVLAAGLFFVVDGFVQLLSTPAQAVNGTRDYLTICFLGVPAVVAYNVMASMFRGMGDARSPMYFIVVACLLNIVLDLIFVGHLDMAAAGAAYATILAQTASVLISVVVIRQKRLLQLQSSDLKPSLKVEKEILGIGTPIALQDGFVQVAFLVITVIANQRGLTDAAAVGIVEKVIGMLFLIPSTLLSTVSVVAAQNFGGGYPNRARLTLRYGVATAASTGFVVALAMQFLAAATLQLFTSDTAVITSGEQYLKAYAWDCLVAGIHFCYSGFFCACGKSIYSFIHNIVSILLARIPLAWLASISFPDSLYPMGMAIVIGSSLSVLICLYFYQRLKKMPNYNC